MYLQTKDYKEEQDVFTKCQDFDISEEIVDETADIVFDIDPYLSMWTALFQEVNI